MLSCPPLVDNFDEVVFTALIFAVVFDIKPTYIICIFVTPSNFQPMHPCGSYPVTETFISISV